MLSKDFKKQFHFRNCAERNCFNCKYRWREPSVPCGPGETSGGRSFCFYDKDSPKTKFYISNFTVCDNWERSKTFKEI